VEILVEEIAGVVPTSTLHSLFPLVLGRATCRGVAGLLSGVLLQGML